MADSPKSSFGLENTVVTTNTIIHDPLVSIAADDLADYHSDLKQSDLFSILNRKKCAYDWSTVSTRHRELAETKSNWRRGAKEDSVGDVDTDTETKDHGFEKKDGEQVRAPNDPDGGANSAEPRLPELSHGEPSFSD